MNETQNLLNEDLKRFRLLMEYDFYIGDEKEDQEMLFDDTLQTEAEGDEPEDEFGGEVPEEGGEDMGGEDMGGEEAPIDGEEEFPEGEVDPNTEFGGGEEMPPPEGMEEPLPDPEPMEDEVELDITELVQGTEAAKASADQANVQIGDLMAKFDNLTQSLNKMDDINAKIDDIEHEIEVRNPTPKEQLEMRSMDSYPYNLKLTDYWDEKEGHYDAMGKDENGAEEEYVLTQDEVDQDYNAIEVKDSFAGEKDKDKMKY
jgi:hypothetical protein